MGFGMGNLFQMQTNCYYQSKIAQTQMHHRRQDPKQSTLPFPSPTPSTQPLSHRKSASCRLLQKKPQILLMKWNSFLEHYHLYKQLDSINYSFGLVQCTLKRRPEELVIYDVPYIESEQVSVFERVEEGDGEGLGEKEEEDMEKDMERIVVSIKLNEKAESSCSVGQKDQEKEDENFTDEEEGSQISQDKFAKEQSTNKNSKLQFSFEEPISLSKQQSKQTPIQQICVAESLRKTAFFSSDPHPKKPPQPQKPPKPDQQNINSLNKQPKLKSKKVQILLKLHNEQQTRRQKAQKIIKEDREYLSKLMARK